ncbi:MAG: hypothetical protein V3V01_20690 [Acidimicrobiales bacterium]
MRDSDPRELFNAFLDDELDETERDVVTAACAESTALATELADLTVVRSQLRSLPDVEPPEGFFESLLERGTASADAELPANVSSMSTARRAVAKRRSVPSLLIRSVSVAAVFLLVLGFGSGIRAIERVPAIEEFASRHAAAAALMPESAETDEFHPMPMEEVKDLGPTGSAAGLQMMGAYQGGSGSDSVLQFVYSDGSDGVISVFRQDGAVKSSEMPPADSVVMAGHDAWHMTKGEADILIIDVDGVTFTMVGSLDSGPAMNTLVDELPGTNPGLLNKVQNSFRRVLDTIGL